MKKTLVATMLLFCSFSLLASESVICKLDGKDLLNNNVVELSEDVSIKMTQEDYQEDGIYTTVEMCDNSGCRDIINHGTQHYGDKNKFEAVAKGKKISCEVINTKAQKVLLED